MYEVRVHSLIRGSVYRTWAKYYGFEFDSSVDNSAGFQTIYAMNSMEECFHCFPGLGSGQICIT
jgi:hypothetical protein